MAGRDLAVADGRADEIAVAAFGVEVDFRGGAVDPADDVAQMVVQAMLHRGAAAGEAFNTVSPQALNLKGYAEAMYRWFVHEPKLSYQPFDSWKASQSDEDWQATREHVSLSPSHSTDKARRLIGYEPRYSSLQAVYEAVDALIAEGVVTR